jgi:hypothetical protein
MEKHATDKHVHTGSSKWERFEIVIAVLDNVIAT